MVFRRNLVEARQIHIGKVKIPYLKINVKRGRKLKRFIAKIQTSRKSLIYKIKIFHSQKLIIRQQDNN